MDGSANVALFPLKKRVNNDALLSFIGHCKDELTNRGLSIEVSVEHEGLVRAAAWLRDYRLSGTFHPDCSALDPRYFWWSKLVDADGEIAAMNVQRLYETSDFIEDFRMGMMYQDGPPLLSTDTPEIVDNPNLPQLSGKIALGGSMWVHPSWRRDGLYKFYSPLVQALSLRKFQWDYYVAIYRTEAMYHALSTVGAMFSNVEPLITGEGAWGAYRKPMSLAWKDQPEFIESILARLNTGSSRKAKA